MKRNPKLTKDYPFNYGYTWAPAVADDLPLAQMMVTPAKPGVGFTSREKVINTHKFLQKTALGQKITYNALRGDLTKIGVPADKIKFPGIEALDESDFCLYNQADVAMVSKTGKAIRDKVRAHSYVIQDSGGFQLVSGVCDFIDPHDVAKKHTLYADSGVSLDLPVSGVPGKKFALATAQMLAANTKIILEDVAPDVKIMNVCHGATLDIRNAYLDIVTKNPAHSLCIAGLRRSAVHNGDTFDRTSPVAFASHILLAMLKTQKLYQHYHVLGVATHWQMALMALAAAVHQKIVTSDSASHSLSAKSGLLLYYQGEYSVTLQGREANIYHATYCGCPMCHSVRDHLWYKIGPHWMSMIHNVYALLRNAKVFNEVAKTAVAKNYDAPHTVKEFLRNIPDLHHKHHNSFLRAVSLIYKTTKISELKALPEDPKTNALFASSKAESSVVPDRMLSILRAYEKFHKKKWL